MLGFGIIIPNLAYYAKDIGASPTEISILISIYSGMHLIFAPLWGRLSDKYGRKPAILLGLYGNAIALVGFGLGTNYIWLFLTRSAAGIASAAVIPTVMAYVADVTTSEERGRGMGMMGAAMGLGFILGPAIGGVMGRHDIPFFVAGALSLLTFVFVLTTLPESLQKETESEHEWVSPRELFRKTSIKSPLTPLFLIAFFSAFSFAGLEATFPLFIENMWNYGQKELGLMFMIMGVIVVPMQGGLLGKLINTFGERKIIIAGMLLNVLGMVLFVNAFSFWTLTIYLTITGIGYQLIRPTNTSWISKQTHIGQGTAIGIMDAFLSLGRVLGPILSGWLYERTLHHSIFKNFFSNMHLDRLYGIYERTLHHSIFKNFFSNMHLDRLYGNGAFSYVVLASILLIAAGCLYFPLRNIERKT